MAGAIAACKVTHNLSSCYPPRARKLLVYHDFVGSAAHQTVFLQLVIQILKLARRVRFLCDHENMRKGTLAGNEHASIHGSCLERDEAIVEETYSKPVKRWPSGTGEKPGDK